MVCVMPCLKNLAWCVCMVLAVQETTPVDGLAVLFLELLQTCSGDVLKALRRDGVEVLRSSFLTRGKDTQRGGEDLDSRAHEEKTTIKGRGATLRHMPQGLGGTKTGGLPGRTQQQRHMNGMIKRRGRLTPTSIQRASST